MGFQAGCERIGALAVPTGPGNLDLQCEFLVDLQSTVYCCTASMGLLLAEEVHKRGIAEKINLKKVIYGSERSSRSMRKKISELMGGAELFDIPGLTELYGPGTGIECPHHDCIHYWADYYILEILDPETLQPLPAGGVGRDGRHPARQRGGAAHPVPDARHYADHPGAVHVRDNPAAPFENPGAHRRRVQVPRCEYLSIDPQRRRARRGTRRAGPRLRGPALPQVGADLDGGDAGGAVRDRADWPGALDVLRTHGFEVVALTLQGNALPLARLAPRGPCVALLAGAEGTGLTDPALARADTRVTIPMTGRVDSLNVATAVSIALYHLRVSDPS